MTDTTPKKATDEDIAVGSRIATLRLASGLSQTAVASSIGVSFQQLQKYEKGKNRIGAGRLQAIASLLGVPVSVFFGQDVALGEDEVVTLPTLKVEGAVELLRAYASIGDVGTRKDVLSLVRTAAKLYAGQNPVDEVA